MIRSSFPLLTHGLLTLVIPIHVSAQNQLPPPPPDGGEATVPENPATELADTISSAVTQIDSTGSRTSEAIANYTVTLTLGALKDSPGLTDLCLNGGDPLQTFVQALGDALSLRGKVSQVTCTGSGHDDNPFKLAFHLHREGQNNLFDENPLLLLLNVVNFSDLEPPVESLRRLPDEVPSTSDREPSPQQQQPAEPPPTAIPLDPRHEQVSHAVITLPPGWKPDQIPPPFHSDSPFATIDQTFTFADGTLTTDQHLVIKVDKVEPADRDAFLKWTRTQSLGFGPSVHLESDIYYPNIAFSGKTDDEKRAAKLISQADNETDAKKFAAAEADLKQAEAIDPGHELLHENRGALAEARGDFQTALTEYQTELRAFPTVSLEMQSIARVQKKMGRKDDAILTLQRWMLAAPTNTFPVTELMDLYHDMGRDDLACATGDLAMNTLNDDGRSSIRFLMLYGHEQQLNHQPQAARATLERLLDLTTDTGFINDAVYELAVQGVDLDRAEELSRASIKHFDQDDADPAHSLYGEPSVNNADFLYSAWDTLGWILFRKGKIAEAETYIRAAWHGKQDPVIGHHLGEILSAEDKPVEALDTWKLALAAVPAAARTHAAVDPDIVAINAGIARLEKQGHSSTITDTTAELKRLHSLDAGPAGKRRGDTTFTIAMTPPKIDAFETGQDDPSAAAIVKGIKLPPDFFPTGSRAQIITEAHLSCTTTCTLTITKESSPDQ